MSCRRKQLRCSYPALPFQGKQTWNNCPFYWGLKQTEHKDGQQQKWSQIILISPWWLAAVLVKKTTCLLDASGLDMDIPEMVYVTEVVVNTLIYVQVFVFLIRLALILYLMLWLTAETDTRSVGCTYPTVGPPYHSFPQWLLLHRLRQDGSTCIQDILGFIFEQRGEEETLGVSWHVVACQYEDNKCCRSTLRQRECQWCRVVSQIRPTALKDLETILQLCSLCKIKT